MATVNTVIARVDAMKPNGYSNEEKAAWIQSLESKVAVEVTGIPAHQPDPDDWDVDLLVPPTYDDVYSLYIFAMMDFCNEEFDNYANSMAMFNAAMSEYRKWYRRTHLPVSDGGIRNVM